MAREVRPGRTGLDHVVLEQCPEGVYVYIFERPDSRFPELDYLQDDWKKATEFCLEEYGIPLSAWTEIPNTGLHGPHH